MNCELSLLSMNLKLQNIVENVQGKNIRIFFSPILTQAENVKAYLIKGAKPLPGFKEYPNPQVGWGALCVRDSIPE